MAINFPGSLDDDNTLYEVVDGLSSNLATGIEVDSTSLELLDGSRFPDAGYVTIDKELITYTGKSTNTLTGLSRAQGGSTVEPHSQGAIVSHFIVAEHHNTLKDAIIAVEGYALNTLAPAIAERATNTSLVALSGQIDDALALKADASDLDAFATKTSLVSLSGQLVAELATKADTTDIPTVVAGSGIVVSQTGTAYTVNSTSSSGGITVGDSISDGTANRILYEDSSNQIAETGGLEFDGEKISLNSTSTIALTNQSTAKNTSSSLTFSATVSSGDTALIVYGYHSYPGPVEMIATFNGVSMTTAESYIYGTNKAWVWYMVNPPVGTYNVVITSSGTTGGYLAGYALSFSGVDVTSPILSSDSVEYNNAERTNFTSITLNTSPGSLALSFLGTSSLAAWPVTAGDGESTLYGTNPLAVSTKAGGTIMSWTLSGDSSLVQIGVSLAAESYGTEITTSGITTGSVVSGTMTAQIINTPSIQAGAVLVDDVLAAPTLNAGTTLNVGGAVNGTINVKDNTNVTTTEITATNGILTNGFTLGLSPADGYVLTSDAGGVATWEQDKRNMRFIIGNGVDEITTGTKNAWTLAPYGGTITGWTVTTIPSGSINLDILHGDLDTLPPNVSITGSQHPTILGDNKASGSVSTWTTSFDEDDMFDVSVASCSGITKCFLDLKVIRG